jgi:hypothetical protein
MVGKIFITRSGYDPQAGKHVKDPYLGPNPSLGACRPDFRRRLKTGDHLFVVSGRVRGVEQFVMGGFEVAAKLNAVDAYQLFPEQHLKKLPDGQLTGNIIVNAAGEQHELDDHRTFDSRIKDYIVGRNPIALVTDDEIATGRDETLDVLRDIVKKSGKSAIEVIGRWGSHLTEEQVVQLRDWLSSVKRRAS